MGYKIPSPPSLPPEPVRADRLERAIGNTMWTPVQQLPGAGVRHRIWIMRCRCGTEKTVEYGNYISGKSLSCGCYRRALGSRGSNRLPVGESAKNQLLLVYRRGAEKRGLAFSLSRDQFLSLTSSDCHYCGQPPHQVLNRAKYTGKGNGAYIYNGIDRIDSDRGYSPDNCLPCCRMCNYAKCDMSQEEFMQWLDGLAEFHISKRQQNRRAA